MYPSIPTHLLFQPTYFNLHPALLFQSPTYTFIPTCLSISIYTFIQTYFSISTYPFISTSNLSCYSNLPFNSNLSFYSSTPFYSTLHPTLLFQPTFIPIDPSILIYLLFQPIILFQTTLPF